MRNILILLLIVLLGLTSCSAESTKKMISGNTPGNINNFGIVATDGEWEYFWAGTTRSEDMNGGKLCKMKSDGTNFQVLSDDNPCYINVVGDWIYYIQNQKPTYYFMGKIYRIQKNGREKQKLSDIICSGMIVVGEWIYFANSSDGDKIYKMKTDGNGLTKLIDSKSCYLQYEDGWLYYATEIAPKNFALYKLNILKNTKPLKILDSIDNFIISNGWIYGSKLNDGLYKIKADGTGYIKLFNERVNNFIVSKSYIYASGEQADYFVQGKGRSCYIYKISLDGKRVEKLPNGDVVYRERIGGLTDNHIYYWVNCAEWEELARMRNDGSDDEILIDRLRKPE